MTLVEPGGTRTEVFSPGSAMYGTALPVYADTPAGGMHRLIEGGDYQTPGDPAKMAGAIIASVDEPKVPRRLVLGSDAYTQIHATLTGRLTEMEAQRDLACSMGFDVPTKA